MSDPEALTGSNFEQFLPDAEATADVSSILNDLNDAQRQAVTAPPEHMLVLAGAGSGKTRVLVHRIAWLNQVEGISPYNIFAVTFTNKAAAEMRQRVEQLQGHSASGMWVGTFHGLAHRLLRNHWKEAKLPQSFQILDSDDQYRLVRRVLKSLELDEARWPPKQAQAFINARKDEGKRPSHIDTSRNPIYEQLVRIYTAYEAACERAGVIDFAELLLRTLELIRDNDSLQAHYGVSPEVAMARFHVRDPRGRWQTGAWGFVELWSHLATYRWLAAGVRSLRLTGLLDFAYTGFARWRLRRRCDETSCATDELAARTDTNRP